MSAPREPAADQPAADEPAADEPARATRAVGAWALGGVAGAGVVACLYAALVAWWLDLPAHGWSTTVVAALWIATPVCLLAACVGLLKGRLPRARGPDELRTAVVYHLRLSLFALTLPVVIADAWRQATFAHGALSHTVAVLLACVVGAALLLRVVGGAPTGRAAAWRAAALSALALVAAAATGVGRQAPPGAWELARVADSTPPPVDVAPRAPSGRRVLVIGVDGGDLDELTVAARAGLTPTLSRFLAEGAALRVRSYDDDGGRGPGSAALWMSIATGTAPERHGMTPALVGTLPGLPALSMDRLMAEAPLGPAFLGTFCALGLNLGAAGLPPTSFRRVPALWSTVSDLGGSVRVLCLPATWPAEPVRGELLSDRGRRSAFEVFEDFDPALPGVAYPRDLLPRLLRAAGPHDVVAWSELEALGAWDERDRRELGSWDLDWDPLGDTWTEQRWLSLAVTGDAWTFRALEALLEEGGPRDLTIAACYLVDQAGHTYWDAAHPETAPRPPTPERLARYAGVTRNTWRQLDAWVTRLVERVDDDTVILLVSDHGMGHTTFMRFTGYHAPDAMLLAWRPGVIRPAGLVEAQAEPPRLIDVAPTILHLLGWPPAEHHEGRVLTELLTDG